MTDGIGLAPSSIRDLRQLGEVYEHADDALQDALRDGLKAASKPLSTSVIREGSAHLPARGGLRARVAASRATVTASLSGREASVSIRATNRQGDDLGRLDDGNVFHPVFGRWVKGIRAQRVPAHQFSGAFERHAPEATRRVNAEIEKALDKIAREAD